jgi:hypothetical protein
MVEPEVVKRDEGGSACVTTLGHVHSTVGCCQDVLVGLAAAKNKRRSSLVDARNSKHGGTCVSNLSPAMGARNEEGIRLSYRPTSLCSLATQFQTRFLESIPRPIAGLNFPILENNQLVVFV